MKHVRFLLVLGLLTAVLAFTRHGPEVEPEGPIGLGDSKGLARPLPGVSIQRNEFEEGFERARQEIPQQPMDSIERCLGSSDTWSCIFNFDFSRVSPEEAADVLNRADFTLQSRSAYLCAVMLSMDLTEVPIFLDTTIQLMNEDPDRVINVFRGAMSLMVRERSYWVDSLLATLLPQDLFSDGSSNVMVRIIPFTDHTRERARELLYEGSLGRWGGTGAQILRAFDRYADDLVGHEPEHSLAYMREVISSPTLPHPTGVTVVQHAIMLADILANRGDIDVGQAEELLYDAFSNLNLQEAAARQFAHDYASKPFAGFDDEMMVEYRAEAQRILGQ